LLASLIQVAYGLRFNLSVSAQLRQALQKGCVLAAAVLRRHALL
jgi:hypothetical protein